MLSRGLSWTVTLTKVCPKSPAGDSAVTFSPYTPGISWGGDEGEGGGGKGERERGERGGRK